MIDNSMLVFNNVTLVKFLLNYQVNVLEKMISFLEQIKPFWAEITAPFEMEEGTSAMDNEYFHADYFIPPPSFFNFTKFDMTSPKDWLLWFFPIPDTGISFTLFNLLQCSFVASCCLFAIGFIVCNPPLMIICGVLSALIMASFTYSEKLSEIELISISKSP